MTTRPPASAAAAFSSSTSAPLCADPRCLISRDLRREEYTICTAVAPDDVFTVRTYGDTRQLYGHRLVRTSSHHNPQKPRSAARKITQAEIVSQVGTCWRRRKPCTVWAAVSHHVHPWLAFELGSVSDRVARPGPRQGSS